MPTSTRHVPENDFETYSNRQEKNGKTSILEARLRNGLRLMIESHRHVKTQVFDENAESAQWSFSFCISGKSRAILHNEKEALISTPGNNYLCFRPAASARFECLSAEPVVFVSVLLCPSFLRELVADQANQFPGNFRRIVNGRQNVSYHHSSVSNGHMQTTLHQILNCPFQGALRRMYLESKAIEVITHRLSQLVPANGNSKGNHLSPKEIERIREAGNILIRNIKNPPTLIELARQVGLNDKKLKYGFKQVFNTTAFGYLRNHRLELGRQFLTDGRLNISEVSYEVGYSERTHFTRAFTKHFGCSPQSYLHNPLKIKRKTQTGV